MISSTFQSVQYGQLCRDHKDHVVFKIPTVFIYHQSVLHFQIVYNRNNDHVTMATASMLRHTMAAAELRILSFPSFRSILSTNYYRIHFLNHEFK
ncbi:hypothetical protein BpHYR1_025122 [Brachionus plicatilis]|uniref:Uncharacterized protein n=1 Tax=Brachionus plicatilis TaxID=10195 RepID=A0A3M7RS18_BRAPC|nr:hypothetical protein BpHYR1_025122 [Brachionus plicatilis]